MQEILAIFHEIFSRPLFNALIFIYNVVPGGDFGIAIIILTTLIRVVLFPVNQKAIISQRALSVLQPKIKEIQDKFKDNKEKQTKAIMEFYKKNNINPLSGCLPLLVQLPILIALYRVFLGGLDSEKLATLYSFVREPEVLNTFFLGFIDLTKNGSETAAGIVLIFLAGAFQFYQTKTMMATNKKNAPKKESKPGDKPDFSNMMQTQMTYVMPIFTVAILWNFNTGLALYWLTTTIFSIFQQELVKRKLKNNEVAEGEASK